MVMPVSVEVQLQEMLAKWQARAMELREEAGKATDLRVKIAKDQRYAELMLCVHAVTQITGRSSC